jgi:hypothetical protein
MVYLITHLILEKLCLLFFFFPWAFVQGIVFMNVIFLNFNDNYGVSLINIEDKGHSFQTILKIRIPFKTIIYNVK